MRSGWESTLMKPYTYSIKNDLVCLFLLRHGVCVSLEVCEGTAGGLRVDDKLIINTIIKMHITVPKFKDSKIFLNTLKLIILFSALRIKLIKGEGKDI